MTSLLKVENLTKKFGGLVANEDISFEIEKGTIVGIVGPNGAGKTTLFNSISRSQAVTSGRIFFEGQDVTKIKAHQAISYGIGRTFQIPKPMEGMTVLDNILIGGLTKNKKISDARKIAEKISTFCGLEHLNEKFVETLNVMQKKRLEIARALAGEPKLLLLDETMAGLNGTERQAAIQLIRAINESGITILMIEHVMEVIMNVSEKVIVIASGKKIVEGTPEEVTSHPEVISAYLGGDLHAKD